MGFGATRAQARQIVNHGMFTVNGKKMDIPSYQVKMGDVVAVHETKKKKKFFETMAEQLSGKVLPSWMTVDAGSLSGKITGVPVQDDLEQVFDVKLIIEYYSTR